MLPLGTTGRFVDEEHTLILAIVLGSPSAGQRRQAGGWSSDWRSVSRPIIRLLWICMLVLLVDGVSQIRDISSVGSQSP